MDPLTGLIAGTGWASGINLYGVVALLNVYGRLGVGDVALPDFLLRTDVLVVALVLYALEFIADKIPYLDNVWDLVHTVIRPLGAAIIGLILVGDAGAVGQVAAGFGSAGLAFASHAAKSTSRVAVNTSPEPISNSVVSLAEDGLVAVVVYFAIEYPVVAVVVVVLLLILGVYLMTRVIGATRRGFRRIREGWQRLVTPD